MGLFRRARAAAVLVTVAWAGVAHLAPAGPSAPRAAVAAPQPAQAAACAVSRVTDGDTLHLTCGGVDHRVRLLGYDTPEIYHPHCAAELALGQEASRRMAALVARGPVTAVAFQGKDRYGRDLARLRIAGQDVTDYMLASPLARPYDGHRHPDWCAG